jgi:hypothetical protein
MKPRLIGVVLLAALAGLALMTVPGAPRAQTGPTLSVDTDPFANPANSASTVGSIEPCRSVPSGSGSFDIDIVIQGVASLSGFEAHLLYNPTVVSVTGMQGSFMLAGGTLLNLSEPVPDSDGTFRMLLATTGEGSGDGVIARLTLQPVADGTSPLYLTNVDMRDFNNNPVTPAAVEDGGVAVGTSCSADSDGDGVSNALDNCPETANPAQENTDVDLEGAGASVSGDAMGDACDDDDENDSQASTQDPGPLATSCPTGPVPLWADCMEGYLGTNLADNCPGPPGTGGDALPPDMNVDGDVNILDVFQMFPVWLGTSARHDLNADGAVNILDVFNMFPVWLSSCT